MSFPIPSVSLHEWVPFAILLATALAVLLLDAFAPRRHFALAWVSGLGLLVTGWTLWGQMLPAQGPFFLGMLVNDRMAVLGGLLIVFASLATLLLSAPDIKQRGIRPGEYYALLLFAAFGMVFLTVSNELLVIFLNIEILSLSLYVLSGMDRKDPRAIEAGFKYFILGSLASALFVFGAAFVFGATGSTQLHVIAERLARGIRPGISGIPEAVNSFWVFVGMAMMLSGLGFKLSLAPFHMWAPDVYQGAPTPVSMLIATASKVAGFIVLVRVVEAAAVWPLFADAIAPLLMGMAVVSMVWGNVAALVQRDLKRLLAYSSVAHGGYMMVAVCCLVGGTDATQIAGVHQAVVMYLLAYVLMNIVAFGVLAALGPKAELPLDQWKGLAKRRGGVAAALALALVSLTGIPPTVGFIGKFYVFQLAVDTGLILLAVAAVLVSVISAFYYLRIVVYMYMEEAPAELPQGLLGVLPQGGVFALGLSASLVLLFGIIPMVFFVL
jgi:NADH-quinone oxidoreductase subunit N